MRAEGQAHIVRIEAALSLVRKFLDWDRALRRLERQRMPRDVERRINDTLRDLGLGRQAAPAPS